MRQPTRPQDHKTILSRLFHTLRPLRPRQIAYQLFYRLSGRITQNGARTQVRSTLGADQVLPPLADELKAPANALPVRYDEAGFSFLNRTVAFGSLLNIDWNYAAEGKLWTYNLNYFEYLRQPGLDPDTGEQLIAAWVSAEDTHKDGWEPYPTSLRLVNWLQFYRSVGRTIPARVHGSIRRQYVDLWRKLEYHLCGNHLLENALALALTARYLNDEAGTKKADKLLRAELDEQYLPDGSHYERSVMYHLVLLWRQLDAYSWLDRKSQLSAVLRTTLEKQLAYARYIVSPDGRFPHFNDSAEGIAPGWAAVLRYAEELGLGATATTATTKITGITKTRGYGGPAVTPPPLATAAGSSEAHGDVPPGLAGYRVWHFPSAASIPPAMSPLSREEGPGERASGASAPVAATSNVKRHTSHITHRLFIDPAPLAPTYIPGHAHADSLTFVLHVAGKPVVIDPAISTYEKNERRARERSTAAHNTVTVGEDLNSSDVWGGFRVGQRARTNIINDQPGQLMASHDGFPGTAHIRTFSRMAGAEGVGFIVTDQLKGKYGSGTARLHFAPGLEPVLSGSTLSVAGCVFTFAGATDLILFDYKASTGWNELANAVGVGISFTGQLETTCSLPISPERTSLPSTGFSR